MKLLYSLLRKLFLIKEIVSKQGIVVFRRYRLLQTPWFAIYIHNLLQSDQDPDLHDHPWSYKSIILSGAYREISAYSPRFRTLHVNKYYAGDVIEHVAEDIHQITLLAPSVWTLVFTSGREREWGYRYVLNNGGDWDQCRQIEWVDHKTYRRLKNEDKLPNRLKPLYIPNEEDDGREKEF